MQSDIIIRGGTFTGTSVSGASFTNLGTVSLNTIDKMHGVYEVVDYGMTITAVSSIGTAPVVQCFSEPALTFGTDEVFKNQSMPVGSGLSIAKGHILRFDSFGAPFAYGFTFYSAAFHTVVAGGNSITISGDYWVKLRRLQ